MREYRFDLCVSGKGSYEVELDRSSTIKNARDVVATRCDVNSKQVSSRIWFHSSSLWWVVLRKRKKERKKSAKFLFNFQTIGNRMINSSILISYIRVFVSFPSPLFHSSIDRIYLLYLTEGKKRTNIHILYCRRCDEQSLLPRFKLYDYYFDYGCFGMPAWR